MSDNLLKLIPTDVQFVPGEAAQQEACKLLSSFVPEAETVYVEVTSEIRFIDPGSNLEEICCSVYGTKLDQNWWKQAMDSAT